MLSKLKLNKIKLPKIKLDWSKWNLRKFDWVTILAVIAYLPAISLVALIFSVKSPYLSFHSKQGIVLHLVWVLFIFSLFLPLIPWILLIILLVLTSVGIFNTISGHERKLPVVGQLI